MKKSKLRQIIKEEIKIILKEDTLGVLSKEIGGYDDKKFLYNTWGMSVEGLEKLLTNAQQTLKWKNTNSKGVLGTFNRRDAQFIKNRIKFIKGIISSKTTQPDYIPDNYKQINK